jgi:hypothetical protein
MKNPALHQEARYEPATVIPLKQDLSLLDWLERNGRLIPREEQEVEATDEEEEELAELMEGESADYEEPDSNFDED